MYEIRPESIKTFIEDRNIRLPRFQRKQTWNEHKNFKLCISIFHEFPIGAVVISKDADGKRWLLDGRQRRNAIISMVRNPEIIYDWAKKFLKLKNNDEPDQVEEKYRREIERYLGEEDIVDNLHDGDNDNDETGDSKENADEQSDEDQAQEENDFIKKSDLLLTLILRAHKKLAAGSAMSRLFDFSSHIDDLDYISHSEGSKRINSQKLRSWLLSLERYCSDNDQAYPPTQQQFEDYLSKFKVTNNSGLKKSLNQKWDNLANTMKLISEITDSLQEAKIGIVEISNIIPHHAQTIFKIINSEGSPLTAAEILSAKPSWNKQINDPSAELRARVKDLYKEMEIDVSDCVRWDFPATLISRINLPFVFPELDYKIPTQFEKKITLGFKLMSAVFSNGISKDHVSELSENTEINWEQTPEAFLKDLDDMGRILSADEFYRYLASWKTSVMDMMSEAVAINFVVLTYKDWLRKEKPIGANVTTKRFVKNSIILFDSLVYEYVTRQWRGSGDSRVAENIAQFNSRPELYEPIGVEKWKALISEMTSKHEVMGAKLSQDSIDLVTKTILYYHYVLSAQAGPDGLDIKIDQDHIIPKSLLNNSTIADKNIKVNNLFNLCLLPKRENISKTDKMLDEVKDSWLIDQIEKYSGINRKNFPEFSKVESLDKLKKTREKLFVQAHIDKQSKYFNN